MRDIRNVLGTVSSLHTFLEGSAKRHAKLVEIQHASATGSSNHSALKAGSQYDARPCVASCCALTSICEHCAQAQRNALYASIDSRSILALSALRSTNHDTAFLHVTERVAVAP